MRAAVNYAGAGILFHGPAGPTLAPARGMHGQRFRWMRNVILFLCPPAARVQITTAAFAKATTSGLTPSSPYAHQPGNLSGDFRLFIMIFGITTWRLSRRSSRGK